MKTRQIEDLKFIDECGDSRWTVFMLEDGRWEHYCDIPIVEDETDQNLVDRATKEIWSKYND